jgi:hypothetical protein
MNELMSSWDGKNVNDLIASWGPPSQTMSDGNGGQILIYDQSRTIVLPGSSTTTTNYNGTTSGNVYGTPAYANYNQNTSRHREFSHHLQSADPNQYQPTADVLGYR